MRRVLPQAVVDQIGHLDPAAIAEVSDEAWPDVRDAEELHDVLLNFIALPVCTEAASADSRLGGELRRFLPSWTPYFEQLSADREWLVVAWPTGDRDVLRIDDAVVVLDRRP